MRAAVLLLLPAVMPCVIIRQRKALRRKDGVFLYFEDNAGVIVNEKGEMKGEFAVGLALPTCLQCGAHVIVIAPQVLLGPVFWQTPGGGRWAMRVQNPEGGGALSDFHFALGRRVHSIGRLTCVLPRVCTRLLLLCCRFGHHWPGCKGVRRHLAAYRQCRPFRYLNTPPLPH